ncbi:hypothetical protein [Angustibacter aerolatus]
MKTALSLLGAVPILIGLATFVPQLQKAHRLAARIARLQGIGEKLPEGEAKDETAKAVAYLSLRLARSEQTDPFEPVRVGAWIATLGATLFVTSIAVKEGAKSADERAYAGSGWATLSDLTAFLGAVCVVAMYALLLAVLLHRLLAQRQARRHPAGTG